MKTKAFDCVEMKRAAQEKIRAQVQGMTREEEIRFFRAGAEGFEQRIQASPKSTAGRADTDRPNKT